MFEHPSTCEAAENLGNPKETGKKYRYGWLYNEDELLKMKINLQVRFM